MPGAPGRTARLRPKQQSSRRARGAAQPPRTRSARHRVLQPGGEYLLPYEMVAAAAYPDQGLTDFLQTTYTAAADLGRWNRTALEIDPHRWDHEHRQRVD